VALYKLFTYLFTYFVTLMLLLLKQETLDLGIPVLMGVLWILQQSGLHFWGSCNLWELWENCLYAISDMLQWK